MKSIKLINLNFWQGRLKFSLQRYFKTSHPDIICGQELYCGLDRGYLIDGVEMVDDNVHLPYHYYSPNMGFSLSKRKIELGNGIFSRYPIIDSKTIFTCGKYNPDIDFTNDDQNIINFQHIVLDVDGQQLNLINHHAYWFNGAKIGNPETKRQMAMIADYVRNLNGPIIMAGDFNLRPSSPSIKIIDKVLINLIDAYGIKNSRTQLAYRDGAVCDYIFVSPEVKVSSFKADDTLVSDHRPLVLKFRL